MRGYSGKNSDSRSNYCKRTFDGSSRLYHALEGIAPLLAENFLRPRKPSSRWWKTAEEGVVHLQSCPAVWEHTHMQKRKRTTDASR